MSTRPVKVARSLGAIAMIGLVWGLPVGAAYAEVGDKEFSIAELWSFGIVATLIGAVLGRFRPWLCLLSTPLLVMPQLISASELVDPSVGPALLAESRGTYGYHLVLSSLLVLCGHLLGVLARRRVQLSQR